MRDILDKVISAVKTAFRYIRAFFIQMKVTPRRKKNSRRPRKEKVDAWTLFWFPFLFVYCELITRLVTATPFFNHIFYPVAFGFALGMIFSVFSSIWKPHVNRIVIKVLSIIVGVFYSAMSIIHNTFSMFMSIPTIFKGAGGIANKYLGEALLSIIGNIYVIILMALPIVFYFLLGKKFVKPHRYKWPMAAAFIIVSLFIFAVTTLFAATGATRSRYSTQYNFNSAASTFGLTAAVRLDFANSNKKSSFVVIDDETEPESDGEGESGSEPESVPEVKQYGYNKMDVDLAAKAAETDNEELKALDEYVQTLTASKQNDYTGLFKGKNMILITAEAFHDAFVDPNLTPTLYRLIHNGFYCPDFYQPAWGGSTSTGEYSLILGLAPQKSIDSIYDTMHCNNYFTMGNQLQRLGYYNIAYHNGTYDFYDRYLTHENLGYGTWCAIGQGLEEITPSGWPEDEEFFEYTMNTYLDLQPFSIYYMTVSGHCTYEPDDPLTEKYYDLVNQYFPDKMETTKYYICYQMELESALTTMVRKLEEAGIADDTVIAMVTDHYPYGLAEGSFGNTEDYISDLYGYSADPDLARDKSAVIIWSGCLEHEYKDMACEIDTPVFSLDVLPTLSNLFGLEYDSRMLVGRDILSEQEPLVFWPDYTWKTDKGTYDSYDGTFTPEPGVEIANEQAYIDRITHIVGNKLNFSLKVVENDYYGHLFGPDNDTSSNEELVRQQNAARKAQESAIKETTEATAEEDEMQTQETDEVD